MRNKKEYYIVDLRPRLNFAAKFYLFWIIIFVALFSYITIYRFIHREEIIERLMQQEMNNTIAENTIIE